MGRNKLQIIEIDKDMKFGIEIECLIDRNIFDKDRWDNRFRHEWVAKHDGSISPRRSYRKGKVLDALEFASIPIYGEKGLEKIETFYAFLKQNFLVINKSCGLHIHHEIRNFNSNQLLSLVNLVNISRFILSFLVKKERIHSGYCNFGYETDNYFESLRKDNKTYRELKQNFVAGIDDYLFDLYKDQSNLLNDFTLERYQFVNFRSFWDHGTVEFRCHEATRDIKKIINWIKFTQLIVKSAKNYNYNFSEKTINTIFKNRYIIGMSNQNKVLSFDSFIRLLNLANIENIEKNNVTIKFFKKKYMKNYG